MTQLIDVATQDAGREVMSGAELAAVGSGVSVATLAISMAFPNAPPGLVGALVLVALVLMAPVARKLSWRQAGVAVELDVEVELRECRRLQAALEELVRSRLAISLHGGWHPFRRRDAHEIWRDETERRYREDFRTWAIRVFDRLETLEVVSPTSRPSVEDPSAAEIGHLPRLFENAARRLERRA